MPRRSTTKTRHNPEDITTIRGYPAIVQEARVDGEKGALYLSKATMFVKSALVSFSSYSKSLDVARRNRSLFVQAMEHHAIV